MLTCMCNNFTSPSKFFSSWTARLILYICPIFYRKCYKSQSLRNASFPWYFPLSNLLRRISVVLFHLIVYPYRKTAFWVEKAGSDALWTTSISELTWSQPWFQSTVLTTLETTLILKESHELNLVIKVDFKTKQVLCTLKSRLISIGNLNISDVNNFTPFSQCLTREIWRRYEY